MNEYLGRRFTHLKVSREMNKVNEERREVRLYLGVCKKECDGSFEG